MGSNMRFLSSIIVFIALASAQDYELEDEGLDKRSQADAVAKLTALMNSLSSRLKRDAVRQEALENLFEKRMTAFPLDSYWDDDRRSWASKRALNSQFFMPQQFDGSPKKIRFLQTRFLRPRLKCLKKTKNLQL